MIFFKLSSKFLIFIIIYLLAKLIFVTVLAEDNKQKESENGSQVLNEQKNKVIKPTVGKRSRVKTLEEFIPSEEVSADKPVAFPSDI